MRIYVQFIDYDLWMTIMNGPHIPKKLVEGKMIEKPYDEWLTGGDGGRLV